MSIIGGPHPYVQVLELLHNALRRPQIRRPILRQSRTASFAVKQRHTQSLLHFEDMSAERRLLDIEVARCPAETSRLSRSNQITKLAQLYH